jgi:PAS domain S-box-containing protein
MSHTIRPTGVEDLLGEEELIVSKTDLKGRITYANDIFVRMAKYSYKELMGAPHSLIRHPDMPRCVFKLLWDTLADGHEIFAYVKNMARCGGFYWVFAHVTPSFGPKGEVVGYHSNRRVPDPRVVAAIAPVYAALLREEQSHKNAKDGLASSHRQLLDFVSAKNMTYDQLVFAL